MPGVGLTEILSLFSQASGVWNEFGLLTTIQWVYSYRNTYILKYLPSASSKVIFMVSPSAILLLALDLTDSSIWSRVEVFINVSLKYLLQAKRFLFAQKWPCVNFILQLNLKPRNTVCNRSEIFALRTKEGLCLKMLLPERLGVFLLPWNNFYIW